MYLLTGSALDVGIRYPDLCGDKFTFHTNEGHIYYDKNNSCADSNFSLEQTTEGNYCDGRTGKNDHKHNKISRDSVEYAAISWGCLLRSLNNIGKETVG